MNRIDDLFTGGKGRKVVNTRIVVILSVWTIVTFFFGFGFGYIAGG